MIKFSAKYLLGAGLLGALLCPGAFAGSGWTYAGAGSMSVSRYDHTATLLPSGSVLVAGGSLNNTSILASAELYDQVTGAWSLTGAMFTPRHMHTATLLPDGKVLVAGGVIGTIFYIPSSSTITGAAEIYDPATGAWTPTAPMTVPRYGHTATLLPNGKVLVAGGVSTFEFQTSAELYDPETGSWTRTGDMFDYRSEQTATLLPNGKVLIAGGDGNALSLSGCELYDPATGAWSRTGNMNTGRRYHTSTLLAGGKVLSVGGLMYSSTYTITSEIYDMATGNWTIAAVLPLYGYDRYYHAATLLPDGRVLITGGYTGTPYTGSWASTYLYDVTADTWTRGPTSPISRNEHTATLLPNGKVLLAGGKESGSNPAAAELLDFSISSWTAAAPLAKARTGHTLTMLPDGRALAAGGDDGSPTATAEIFSPAGSSWSAAAPMSVARTGHTAVLLADGRVLTAGGYGGGTELSGAELYAPAAGTWSPAAAMATARRWHTAVLLADGRVLAAGGYGGGTELAGAELYDPLAGTWSAAAAMSAARKWHTAVLLPDGRVLAAGGYGGGAALASAELYDPVSGSWTTASPMNAARHSHTATLLPGGEVLVAGGDDGAGTPVASAEIYDPSSGGWTTVGPMLSARKNHSAQLLPGGKVLVAGGLGSGGALAGAELFDLAAGTWAAAAPFTAARANYALALLADGRVLAAGGAGPGALASSELARHNEYYSPAYAALAQPAVTAVAGSAVFPARLSGNTVYALSGARFKGASGGGGTSCSDAAANSPRVYLQRMDSAGGEQLDVSSSVYPMSPAQWQQADSRLSFRTPACLAAGHYYLTVRSKALASDGRIISVDSPLPLPPGGLAAESLSGNRIKVSWTPSPTPGVTGYRLYSDNGTGSVDYSAALAAPGPADRSYTTGVLASSSAYKFALRAVAACGAEQNSRVLASASSAGALPSARTAIKVPLAGKTIYGDRVTVTAEREVGAAAAVSRVLFQYKASSSSVWLDLPAAGSVNPNPDLAAPYFVQWDVTALSSGTYDLRAAAYDPGGVPDPQPPAVSLMVSPQNPDILETDQGAGAVKKVQKVNNTVDSLVQSGGTDPGKLTTLSIPAGAVSDFSVTVAVTNNSAVTAPDSLETVGGAAEISLSNGQSLLSGGRTAAITLPFPDADGDGLVDGTALAADRLVMYSAPSAAGPWTADLSSAVNLSSRTVTGYSPHFSFFSLFYPLSAGLGSVRAYPTPWRPGSGGDYDAAGGITFDNLPATAEIKIFTVTGALLRTLTVQPADNGRKVWDGKNSQGDKAASGVYLALMKAGKKEKTVKIAVER